MMRTILATFTLLTLALTIPTIADARRCDGFNGCRCGTTAARDHGLPYDYHGMNLKKASTWYAFPRTSCHAGAVGVQPHHVYTVLQCNGDGTATVHDDAGTYTRRVAGNVFVDPNGNHSFASADTYSASSRHYYYHYRHHRYRHHYRHYAHKQNQPQPIQSDYSPYRFAASQ